MLLSPYMYRQYTEQQHSAWCSFMGWQRFHHAVAVAMRLNGRTMVNGRTDV